ncbi:Trp biosynthesis-associated membrane protein [Paraoerskovia sediminicola]|uniref:Trp biosynthesis-associated membrane protein n=1 Tax=Paraoerskovia sediminicola TaxID=1138587 RepID=UPI002573EC42|nr:Trp biosynthesis-associated membrane protein [Paraoerskovia sediminicola]
MAARRPDRRTTILGLLVLGGLALLVAVPTWLQTTGSSPIDPSVEVTVTGTDAAPGVGAAALVVLAAGLALGLVGRFARWLVLLVAAVGGVVVVASALAVLLDPRPVARSAAADATGVTVLTSDVQVGFAAWAAVAVGVLVVVLVAAAARAATTWPAGSSRHERTSGPGATDGASPVGDGASRPDAPRGGAAGPAGEGTSSGTGSASGDPSRDPARDRDRQSDVHGDHHPDPGPDGADGVTDDPAALWDAITRGEPEDERG